MIFQRLFAFEHFFARVVLADDVLLLAESLVRRGVLICVAAVLLLAQRNGGLVEEDPIQLHRSRVGEEWEPGRRRN